MAEQLPVDDVDEEQCDTCADGGSECGACDGSGENGYTDCWACGGSGWAIPSHCCACGGSPYCQCCRKCGGTYVGACSCPIATEVNGETVYI
ncbi:hypothetical protein [Phytohabitans rumicis]|uniref:Uncharacterized protein n=1 Tax=Phytohabitans rumicis TaxID=1076125 RepID=A0A6V8LA22_9ACTN|nr:hypothetical protein [Phytohabitans rumicis]GFJ92460.1 hypothetical protein Prum_061020 [Phytohabitans rumicis]